MGNTTLTFSHAQKCQYIILHNYNTKLQTLIIVYLQYILIHLHSNFKKRGEGYSLDGRAAHILPRFQTLAQHSPKNTTWNGLSNPGWIWYTARIAPYSNQIKREELKYLRGWPKKIFFSQLFINFTKTLL